MVDGERENVGKWVSLKDNNAKDPATFAWLYVISAAAPRFSP